MCTHWDNVFQCGHRGFVKFVACPQFGQTCMGNNGVHTDWPVADICHDCKSRAVEPNPNGRDNDPYIAADKRRAEAERLETLRYIAERDHQRQEAESATRKRLMDKLEAGRAQAAAFKQGVEAQKLQQRQQWQQYQVQQPQQQQQQQQQQGIAQMIAQGQGGSFQRVPGQGVQWVPAPQIQGPSQGSSQGQVQSLQGLAQLPQGQALAQEQGSAKSKAKGKGKATAW